MGEYTKAKQEANARYDAKTYKKIIFRLRLEDDAELINAIEELQDEGITRREWLSSLFYGSEASNSALASGTNKAPDGSEAPDFPVSEIVDAILSHRGYLNRQALEGIISRVLDEKSAT